MKKVVLSLMRNGGVFDLCRLINRKHALILTYHRFTGDVSEANTSASDFDYQLAYLKQHYRVVSYSDIVGYLTSGEEMPAGLAAITIDDGYKDSYDIAFPLLRRHGLPATVFVVTRFVEGRIWLWTDKMRYIVAGAGNQETRVRIAGNDLLIALKDGRSRAMTAERVNSELKKLSDEEKDETINRIAVSLGVPLPLIPPDGFSSVDWEQVMEMDAGGIEINSHSVTHPILTHIDDDRLDRELIDSRAQLESVLNRRIEHFCYPNGNFDDRVKGAVGRAGYLSAVSIISGFCSQGDDMLSLRRIHSEDDKDHFIQSISGFEEIKNRIRN